MLAAPHPGLRASVVVPAKDEEALISSCIAALAAQEGVPFDEYEVLLVLDRCTDGTEEKALEAAGLHPGFRLHLLDGPGRGAGHARRVGMEAACGRLEGVGRPGGLVASTDADTVVAPDWLLRQLECAGRGARAIGGRIELREDGALPEDVPRWREEQGRLRLGSLLAEGAGNTVEHWQFSGASLALTAEAYGEIGGLEPRAALEDEGLERALRREGIPIERPLSVRVSTSARTVGRANRGLARDLALASWVRRNTFDADAFRAEEVAERKNTLVTAVVPARGGGRGTAALLDGLRPLRERGLVDEVVVVLRDDSPPLPAGDYRLHRDGDLMPSFGPVRGYGDVLWRGLSAAQGGVVLYLDPAVPDPDGRRALGLLAPLVFDGALRFVSGYAEEPMRAEASALSELVGRPVINLYRPELAGFVDPLSPELAARTDLLRALPFPVGHGAPMSLLLDAASRVGVGAMAQVRLGPRPQPAVPLPDLAEAAHAILAAAMLRVHDPEDLDAHSPGPLFLPVNGRFESRRVPVEERPPLDGLPQSV